MNPEKCIFTLLLIKHACILVTGSEEALAGIIVSVCGIRFSAADPCAFCTINASVSPTKQAFGLRVLIEIKIIKTFTIYLWVNGLVHIKKSLLHINEDEKKGPQKNYIKSVFTHK